MRKTILPVLAALALALPGCTATGGIGIPTSPGAISSQTQLDDRLAIGAELAYKTFRLALELAVDAGVVKGELATRMAALDNRAYSATLAVRAAYRSGNAASYQAAYDQALQAINAAQAAIKGS